LNAAPEEDVHIAWTGKSAVKTIGQDFFIVAERALNVGAMVTAVNWYWRPVK
jgi:hypothetical protein